MKKIWVTALVAVLGLAFLGTSAFAACGMGGGPGAKGKPVDVTAFKAFQKETLPLRDEMMVKRVELRNEFLKEKPDQNRIATLQKEMIDLRLKIRTAAEKNGLPAFGQGMGGHGGMGGRGHGMGGHGMAGHGGMGMGSGDCPMQSK
jgi:zinc resistance-associated protein